MADPRSPVDQRHERAFRSLAAERSLQGAGRLAGWLVVSSALHGAVVLGLLALPGREPAGSDRQVGVLPAAPVRPAEPRAVPLALPREEPPPRDALIAEPDLAPPPAPRTETEIAPL